MTTQPVTIVQRLWNDFNVLPDDGIPYSDHVEQLTSHLFFKMADEQELEFGKASVIPAELGWRRLIRHVGYALETHYRYIQAQSVGRQRYRCQSAFSGAVRVTGCER